MLEIVAEWRWRRTRAARRRLLHRAAPGRHSWGAALCRSTLAEPLEHLCRELLAGVTLFFIEKVR